MSAWYIFATLGFYPAQPTSGSYVAGVPLVAHARIQVPGRKALIIERVGTGEGLLEVTLASKAQNLVELPHSRLVGGGIMRFSVKSVCDTKNDRKVLSSDRDRC